MSDFKAKPTFTYDEVKSNLAKASKLIDAGEYAEAHALIKPMAGRGMSQHDLIENLSCERISAMRRWFKKENA